MRATPYRGQYQGLDTTSPTVLGALISDPRLESLPPLCATDLLLSSPIPGHLHILSFLTTAGDTIAPKKTEEEHLLKWFGLAALPRSSHVLPQSARTPHQPPEPQPDMASRFSNQWICLLTFTKHFAGKCIGAIEFILVAKGS